MYGLVLQGGGAKGSYQVGAWKALREMGIPFDAVTGTSIGSLNGALIVQDDFDVAWDLWYNIKPEMAITGDPAMLESLTHMDFENLDIGAVGKYLRQITEQRGLDISPLRHLIDSRISEERVRSSAIRFGLVTVSLTDLEPIEVFIDQIPQGRLTDYLIASSNLPVFKIEPVDGKVYIDGGFYDKLPVNLMASSGKKKIITIELSAMGIKQKDPEGVDITRIQPSDDIGLMLEFSSKRSRVNLEMGYYDALRVFKKFQGNRYYLTQTIDKEKGFHRLTQISEETTAHISRLLGVTEYPSKRMLFEVLVPKLMEWLKLGPAADYDTLWQALMEHTAEKMGVNRYQLLQYQDLEDQIRQIGGPAPKDKTTLYQLPDYFRQSSIFQWSQKDDLLLEIGQCLFAETIEKSM